MRPLPCIMLVDDDQTTNFLNQLLLNKLAITEHILVATDGGQALQQLQQHQELRSTEQPMLLLLDVNMPGMNGIQFLEAYQQLPLVQQQGVVMVMLTTSLHPRDVQRVQELNIVADFISKPLTAEKVNALLQAHFLAA